MGCDGGSIVSRRDIIVKTKKQSTTTTTTTNNNNADDQSNMEQLWNTCAYSGEPLKEPIVCCRAGQLYNKESILELLIQKKDESITKVKHIDSRDTTQAHFPHSFHLSIDYHYYYSNQYKRQY